MKKLILIALAVFTFSCSSDDDAPTNTPDPQANGYAYMRGKMNNVDFDYTVNNTAADNYTYSGVGGFHGLGFQKWYHYGGMLSTFNPPNFAPQLIISWENLFYFSGTGYDLERDEFYNTLSNLPTNFLTDEQEDAHMPGLSVQFKDVQQKFYSTVNGPQNGSTLTVVGSSQEVVMGQKIKTVWGTFSCKMYAENNPADMKQITNGTYKIILAPNN